jgi:hypothetical protein
LPKYREGPRKIQVFGNRPKYREQSRKSRFSQNLPQYKKKSRQIKMIFTKFASVQEGIQENQDFSEISLSAGRNPGKSRFS